MNSEEAISDLKIREIENTDDISKLDFTDDDKTDPLEVNAFFHSPKANEYQKQKLTSIWVVFYKDELVGCFTLSMFAVGIVKLAGEELVVKAGEMKSYPAVLLGQFGVDKAFRGKGIGYWICQHFTGLSRRLSKKIACRYIVLQTDENRTKLYNKLHFELSPKKPVDGKVWMYRRLEN